MTRRTPPPRDPSLTTPQLAIAALTGHSLFYTPAAHDGLREWRPDLLNTADERAFVHAAQNPAQWRQLDRRLHFEKVLLCGDPATFRPLLRHLLETRDFTLTYLDHTSLIFARAPAPKWSPPMLDGVKQKFTGKSAAPFLVGLAGKLLAVGRLPEAKGCLGDALALDGDSPDAHTQLALYHAQLQQWPAAQAECERALAIEKNFVPALQAKAQILCGGGRFNEALEISQRVAEANPRDPAALFLHAKIAHEAHAFQREIAALKQLVALAERAGAPVSGYRIYLAQAYAAHSEAAPALAQFEAALTAGDLSAEQRKFVDEAITRIKSRSDSAPR